MSNPNPKLENLKSYKPKWNLGKTKTIRVPIAIAEEVLEFAHQLDERYSPDTSELFDKEKARSIISKGLSYRSNRGAKIKDCLAQLGIVLGFKIEKNKFHWNIVDTSESINIKEVESIIFEGLSTSSEKGAKVKNCLAQLGNLIGFKIERKGQGGKWIFTDTSDKNLVSSGDKEIEPERELNQIFITDTSELFNKEQARAIIFEGLSYPAKLGGKIKIYLAQIGILLGFKIEQINRNWTLVDSSELIDIEEIEKIEAIISEGLSTSAREGGKIKTCLAQVGILLGFKIERKGQNSKWKFTDTSDKLPNPQTTSV